MTPLAITIVLRLAVAAFFILTAGYGVLNCSPFAWDMFVRPQLFAWLARFVAWHHVWFAGAYAVSLITIAPALGWRRGDRPVPAAARVLAAAYAVALGAVALWLLMWPYLPTLWTSGQGLPLALISFVPLLWLAAIDHASCRPDWLWRDRATGHATGPFRILVTCGRAAGCLWLVHLLRATMIADRTGGMLAWTLTAAWTLAITLVVFAIAAAVLSAIAALAECSSAPRASEYWLIVLTVAVGVEELFRRILFPSLALGAKESAAVAALLGLTVSAMWSAFVVRRRVPPAREMAAASELFFTPVWNRTSAGAGLAALLAVSFIALHFFERLDWDFDVQRLILAAEWIAVFGLMLRTTDRTRERTWASPAVLVASAVALAAFLGLPRAASALAASTRRPNLEPSVAFDRHAAAESAFRLIADGFVVRPGFDTDYYRDLQRAADFSGAISVTIPTIDYPASASAGRRPDIFLFVIDSLRRDYVSAFNPAVTFTPNLEQFAADSFVFRNAFTRHGGTELAMPSIWAGAAVVRRVATPAFARMNAIEKLVDADGYRMAINEHTIEDDLSPATPVTMIDPDVPNVDTDFCANLTGAEQYLDASAADAKPVFGLFRPMNIHILNTMRGGQRSLDHDYPGFYAPYASRVRRLDGCFGAFIAYLKQRGRYDNSIVIVTADHGDSLGEGGNWGHAVWLFPEIVRIPLIIHVPPLLKRTVTTDLGRVAFTTDIAPTLYALLGHPIDDRGPLFGAPLFVPADQPLPSRRRDSFLLTSSYGATYGLLRRNGRLLYVSDVSEWREYAYDLTRQLIAAQVVVDDDLRRVNQRLIRERIADQARFYHVSR